MKFAATTITTTTNLIINLIFCFLSYWFVCVFVYVSPYGFCSIYDVIFSSHGAAALIGPRPPHYSGSKITLRHTTLGRTSLED
jgi:hypothetical protein